MVMAPVAAALDILQGEQQCALGYVLPTISTLKKKLNCADRKYTASVREQRDSLLQGIQKRFGAADKEFLMAAVTHPRFKLSWIDDAELRANCTMQSLSLSHRQILQQSRQVIIVTCKMSGWMTSSTSMKRKWNSHRNIYSS